MKNLACIAILVLFAGVLGLKYLPPAVNPDELSGDWHGDAESAERWRFDQSGTVQLRSLWPTLNGSEQRQLEGTYEIAGRGTTGYMELRITWAGNAEAEVWQIASLNDRSLLLVAPNGIQKRYRSSKTLPSTKLPKLG